MRRVLGFFAAVLLSYCAGAIAATQVNLSAFSEFGVEFQLGQRIQASLHDLHSMFLTYAPIIALSFLLAFAICGFIARRLPNLRTFGFVLAGGLALICAHLGMHQLTDITPVAATRGTLGLVLQGVAGCLGGYLFAQITAKSVTAS